MNHLRHQNYKSEYAETKYLNNIRKKRILKLKKRPSTKRAWHKIKPKLKDK